MRRFSLGPVLLLVLMLASAFPVGDAHAIAYTKSVNAPQLKDGRVVGVADINTDCEGTFGCYSYIKIEYKPENPPSGVPWLNPWQYVDGGWANQGRNEISVDPHSFGCGYYRTVVDTYNDMPGDGPISISVSAKIGSFEFSPGSGIERYHQTKESRSTYICTYV